MFYPEHDCMIQCLLQREMVHEKGFIKPTFLTPLAATFTEAETCQLCWATGTPPTVEARDRVTRGALCFWCDACHSCARTRPATGVS